MSNIKFVSHQDFPEDPYVKEVVYLCIDDKYRVAYTRKSAKNGGLFWGVPSIGVMKDGAKTYCKAFMQDSSFLEKDIESYLEKRSWESGKSPSVTSVPAYQASTMASQGDFGEIPF
jgi:hypothetical protein